MKMQADKAQKREQLWNDWFSQVERTYKSSTDISIAQLSLYGETNKIVKPEQIKSSKNKKQTYKNSKKSKIRKRQNRKVITKWRFLNKKAFSNKRRGKTGVLSAVADQCDNNANISKDANDKKPETMTLYEFLHRSKDGSHSPKKKRKPKKVYHNFFYSEDITDKEIPYNHNVTVLTLENIDDYL